MNGLANGPLAGLRVLELADEKGQFCGKLLGDLGADVVKIEPPGGEPCRNVGPFLDDIPHPERSLSFWYYNTSKRGVALNLEERTTPTPAILLIIAGQIVIFISLFFLHVLLLCSLEQNVLMILMKVIPYFYFFLLLLFIFFICVISISLLFRFIIFSLFHFRGQKKIRTVGIRIEMSSVPR